MAQSIDLHQQEIEAALVDEAGEVGNRPVDSLGRTAYTWGAASF